MSKSSAWVTLTTNDSYALGALVLAASLKRVGTKHELAILVTPGVSQAMKAQLRAAFNHVEEVDVLDSKDVANLKLLTRPELGITFTKLHCWRLVQYEKCVFLDADTLVLQNCDELFEKEEFSAAPDAGWPDCFNSGVFVYKPSADTFSALIDFALIHGSFDGGDQGLLNLYFKDWATKDISKHLSFVYNMCSTATYSYLPALKQYGQNIKIIHFIGTSKPWLHQFNAETQLVSISETTTHLAPFLQTWWDLFCTHVHPVLSSEMTSIRLSSWYSSPSFSSPNPPNLSFSSIPEPLPTPAEPYIFRDPWDDFLNKVETPEYHPQEPFPPHVTPESSNYHNDNSAHEQHTQESGREHYSYQSHSIHHSHDEHVQNFNEKSTQDSHPPDNSFANDSSVRDPSPVNSSQLQTDSAGNQDESGIAGALSKIKLGSAASAGNAVIEDHLRRQSWEQGVIDYMGRDAFTNIWDKICQTVGGPSQPEIPEETVESTSEAPADINLVATSASTEQVSVTAVQTSIVGSTKTEVSQPQPVKQAQSADGKKTVPPISTSEQAPSTAQPATPTVIAPTPPLSPVAAAAEAVEALTVSEAQPPVPPKRHQKKTEEAASSAEKEDSQQKQKGKGKGKK
ncbi:unnamed protein product [Bemisia tabaci]|uniref:glycogenin glucosyltransferase n=1 Tax=Bemisia tabaci TaxID=7038 RepID=A0A9P0G411_BEMTA|nr:unnamed protein product [Bemisia tabaci]